MAGRRVLSVRRHFEDYPPPTPLETRCRIWQGTLDKDGYGYVMRPDGHGHSQRYPAHRWAYEAAHGPLKEGMVVRHRCDNRPCFRVSHLIAGTVADNNRDALERGRQWRPPALSPGQSRRVIELATHGWSSREIARCFGVSQSVATRIIRLGPDGLEAYLEEMDHG